MAAEEAGRIHPKLVIMTARPSIPSLPEEDHRCVECGVAYGLVTVTRAVESIRGLTADLRATIAPLPEPELHHAPQSGGWSITEYLCHLRDVYVTYTIRLHRTRTEADPVLEPMLNDLRARRFRYNDRDPYAVLDELQPVCDGFCDEVGRTTAAELERTATRLPGERRTALWLIRQAMHEGVHHRRDILRLAAGRLE